MTLMRMLDNHRVYFDILGNERKIYDQRLFGVIDKKDQSCDLISFIKCRYSDC